MRRIVLGLMLALILTIALGSTVMADGPSINGYGADPTGEHPPNDVYVPSAAFENRGELPPNADSNGAIFYPPVPPSMD
jgi:hypothetical protein